MTTPQTDLSKAADSLSDVMLATQRLARPLRAVRKFWLSRVFASVVRKQFHLSLALESADAHSHPDRDVPISCEQLEVVIKSLIRLEQTASAEPFLTWDHPLWATQRYRLQFEQVLFSIGSCAMPIQSL